MKSHKDLEVWKTAMSLAKQVYEITQTYPKEEIYGLVSQMRRCAVSIPSNIAEGASRNRNGVKEFIQFLYIATGSASELDTQIELSHSIGLADTNSLTQLQDQTTKVLMMLRGLIRSLKRQLDT
jgi:four helix bundle protein